MVGKAQRYAVPARAEGAEPIVPGSRATPLVSSPGAALGDQDGAARHPYPFQKSGLTAGRAGSPRPTAVANPRVRVYRDGAHGVTRPPCPIVAKNGYSIFSEAKKFSGRGRAGITGLIFPAAPRRTIESAPARADRPPRAAASNKIPCRLSGWCPRRPRGRRRRH